MFAPLVTSQHWLTCELDILFLRAEPPGILFTANHAGDLDNRIKVLFDSLRQPDASELPSSALPKEDQIPFLCLLEDDKLITAVRLESERLLERTATKMDGSKVRLVINVTVKAHRLTDHTLQIIPD